MDISTQVHYVATRIQRFQLLFWKGNLISHKIINIA